MLLDKERVMAHLYKSYVPNVYYFVSCVVASVHAEQFQSRIIYMVVSS